MQGDNIQENKITNDKEVIINEFNTDTEKSIIIQGIIRDEFEGQERKFNNIKLIIISCVIVLSIILIIVILISQSTKTTMNLQKDIYTIKGNELETIETTTKSVITIQEETTTEIDIDWNLVLVNENNPLPYGFSIETEVLPNGKAFDKRAFSYLTRMLEDGKAVGLDFVVCSAYRPYDYQQKIFDELVTEYINNGKAPEEAYNISKTMIAVPGTSEHTLGLAVDIVALDYQTLDEGIENTEEFKWLNENAHKYGFILRYPKGKTDITGIIYEPWHYRYVGEETAKEIKDKDICFEEYLQ